MGITACGALDTDQPLPLVMVAERAGSQSLQVGGGALAAHDRSLRSARFGCTRCRTGYGGGGRSRGGLDAETLAAAIETVIKRHYANWADEPIPALQGLTPCQAMQSASGTERVKGLLRSYEDDEARQAAQQGRRAISYQFLWDALGLRR